MRSLLRPSFYLLAACALLGCGRGGSAGRPSAATTATASAPTVSPTAPPASASAPVAEPATAPPPSSFVGARSDKACRAQTVELAGYQTRGDVALAAQADVVAASWRVRIAGRAEEQIAFGSYDKDGKPSSRPRGMGMTQHEAPPRVFPAAGDWVVAWFDERGLAYARAKVDPLPAPEVSHVGAVGPEVSVDVGLGAWPQGGGLAAAPFGADKTQLGVFAFAAEGPAGSSVKVVGVSHHSKQPHRPAVAAGPSGTFVVWDEGGAVVATRFDASGKEIKEACTVAPAGEERARLSLAATPNGAIAMWMEGTAVRTRALDASGCPSSPVWTAAEGKWATLASLGEGALLAWVTENGRLLAARLAPNGAPPARGIDAAEGSAGVKDPPGVVSFGSRAAFGWAETMSPMISTKRLQLRVVDASCIP